MVLHDLALATRADWIVVTDGGRVIEAGSPKGLLSRPGGYWAEQDGRTGPAIAAD